MTADGLPIPTIVSPQDEDTDMEMDFSNPGETVNSGGGYSPTVTFAEDDDLIRDTYQPTTNDIQKLSAFLDRCKIDYDFWTQTFEHKYGMTHPPFVCDSFADALTTSKELMRPIVVNLQSPALDCLDFNSLVLTSGPLAHVLSENFIFWVGFCTDALKNEAQRSLGMALRQHPTVQENASKFGDSLLQFPVTLVLGHVDSSPMILEVMQGIVPADEFIAKLYGVMDTFASFQEKARTQRARNQQQRTLIDEQNSAYEESLRRDAEKAKVKAETERVAKEAMDKKMNVLTAARRAALAKMDSLAPEPAAGVPSATIQIRLPDGSKIQRKFDASRPLLDVFDFVEATIAQRLQDDTFLDDATALDSAEPQPWSITHYEFTMSFPKKRLSHADENGTIKELGLAPQALLHLGDSRANS